MATRLPTGPLLERWIVNSSDGGSPVEYVAARRVLLDALSALSPHGHAIVLSGAQAVYLRTGANSLPIAEFTTDGDLTIDPGLLADAPPLGELMEAAGFQLAKLQGAREPGIWQKEVEVNDLDIAVPIDLIVPSDVAPPGGTRGARLPGHGKRAARKTRGLEAALVDNDLMAVQALDPGDRRRAQLRIAGVAALLVAKVHKLNDRITSGRKDRLNDKDAADVVRLLQTSSPAVVASTLQGLRDHPVAGRSTRIAVGHFGKLFGNRAGLGIEMAARALREAMPEERIRAICISYTEELMRLLDVTPRPTKGP